jgi:hypothetical protein
MFVVNQETDSSQQNASGNTSTSTSAEPEPSSGPEADEDWDLDGNIATVEFTGLAVGEDSYVSVDAFALVIEDELSLSGAFVELAVD